MTTTKHYFTMTGWLLETWICEHKAYNYDVYEMKKVKVIKKQTDNTLAKNACPEIKFKSKGLVAIPACTNDSLRARRRR